MRRARKSYSWHSTLVIPVFLVLVIILIVTSFSHAHTMQETREAAYAYVEQREAMIKHIPLLSVHEKQQLRTNPNRDHVHQAQILGIDRLRDRDVAAVVTSDPEGPLRQVRTNQRLIMDPRMSYGVPYLTHDAHNILQLIAERFQQELRDRDLPPHRILVTSVLRTTADQARLRGVNVNAARGVSSHEHGTTADIHYRRFDYVADIDDIVVPDHLNEALYKSIVQEAMADFSSVYQSQLKALLGRVMREMHEDGKLMVTMEHRQPVFHFTIDRPLTDYQLAELVPDVEPAIPSSAG